MGFLQLLSADSLSATYNTKTHQLILNAQGKAPNYTSGISFQRKPLIGGLLFALEGWVGPRGEGNMSFDITDHFDVELPSKATPSNTIVIKMLDGTKTIPIMFVPPPPPPGAASSNGSNGANTKTPQVPEDKDVGTTDLTVLYKEPFNITNGVSVPPGGSVDVSFDRTFLTLTGASVQHPVSGVPDKSAEEIVWTFDSLQMGDTQIKVTVSGGMAQFVTVKTYNVEIVVLDATAANGKGNGAKSSTSDATATGNGKTKTSAGVGVPLSWLGFVNIGVNLIKKSYQNVVLLEADATPIDHKPVNSPWGLNHLRVVCRVEDNKTAIIKSTGWGEFGPIEYIDAPWLEDADITWPLSPELGMPEAWDILRKAGHKDPVRGCTLRQPVYPGMDQVFYIFEVENQFLAVGVKDHKVHRFSAYGSLLA